MYGWGEGLSPTKIEKWSKKPCVSCCYPSRASVCQLSLRVWSAKSISQMGALATVINSSASVTAESHLGLCVKESARDAFVWVLSELNSGTVEDKMNSVKQCCSLIRSVLAIASSAYLKGNFLCSAAVSWWCKKSNLISLMLTHYAYVLWVHCQYECILDHGVSSLLSPLSVLLFSNSFHLSCHLGHELQLSSPFYLTHLYNFTFITTQKCVTSVIVPQHL